MRKNIKEVGEGIITNNGIWSFGGDTPKKFNNHVKRSIPFYLEGHEIVAKLSDFFVEPQSVCYELGVSTAVLIKKLAERHPDSIRWIGLDIEEKMIEQAEKTLSESNKKTKNIDLLVDDINLHPYEKTDFIVAYYTIQFVPPRLRQRLINKIYETLNWGGGFVLFEKVRGPDARFQDLISTIYSDYKLEQGYSAEEVISKTQSLKGVLEPFSSQGNIDMIKRAGFVDYMSVFKYLCFEGILCIK